MRSTNLRIEIAGLPRNEYRITDHDLEFRAFDPRGGVFPDQRGSWRRLTAGELLMHLRLNTVVGEWFLHKMSENEEELETLKAS